MTVIGSAEIEIRPDSSRFGKDAENQIDGALGGVRDNVGKTAKVIGGALGAAFALDKVREFASGVITAGSDMQETLSKSRNIFGEQAAEIERWASTSATSVGLSKQAALAATAQYGDMFKQLGFAGGAAKDASTNLVKTAADLGSFHNLDTSDVLDRIGASLRGEFDSLQALIPNINAARVENEALAATGKKAAKDLTAQEKATATLAIIQKDGAAAANDFAETNGGLAGQQKILAAQMEDLKAKIGEKLLPVMTAITAFMVDNMFPAFEAVSGVVGKAGSAVSDSIGKLDVKAKLESVTEAFRFSFSGEGWDANGSTEKVGVALGTISARVDEAKGRFMEAFRFAFSGEGWEANGAVEKVAVTLAYIATFMNEKFDEIIAFTRAKWPEIQEAIGHVMNVIQDVITVVTTIIQTIWDSFGDNILQSIQNRLELIRRTIDNALEIIKSTITLVLAVINGDWGLAWESIKNIFSAVWDQIKAILSFALAEIKNALAVAWDVIKLGTSLAWEGIKAVVGGVLEGLKFLFLNFTGPGLIVKHWDTIRGATSSAFDAIRNTVRDALNGIVDFFRGVGGSISGATSGMWDGVKNSFRSALNWVIEKWNNFKIPAISVAGQPVSPEVNFPNIPTFAQGGVVSARAGGIPGIFGEAGYDEAIVPLNHGFVDMLVAALVQAGVGGGRGGPLVENLTIQNSKTLQENLDEVDRLAIPL